MFMAAIPSEKNIKHIKTMVCLAPRSMNGGKRTRGWYWVEYQSGTYMCMCAWADVHIIMCVCVLYVMYMYVVYAGYLHVRAVPTWSVHPLKDSLVEADGELREEERRALEESLGFEMGNEEPGNDELPVPVRDPGDISEEASDPGDAHDEITYGDDEESVRSSALDDLSYRDPA